MQAVNRLYGTFAPDHYTINLNLDRKNRSYIGTAQITGTAPTSSPIITLHSKQLQITKVLVNNQPATFSEGIDDELTITARTASASPIIDIEFSGTITDAMHGIYPCYFEYDGVKKELLATQFESHHAREVFPCVDEPEAKATFDLTLVTEPEITVLGNMPVRSQEVTESGLTTVFETSPRMSTYLLAFVAGELIHKETTTKDGVLVRTYATPAQKPGSLDFALDVAKRSIEFFNDYFGIPYPLPKSDHIALPDFSSGAMENWGLITYRESCLLVDPENTSVPVKEFTATVVAHELSHQWFGNLVTMRWWDDLWLNESFANLMEYIAIDALFPEWNIWMSYATNETLSAQRRDSLPGVQAVRTGVNHPDEISTLFDPSIVYAKGSKLLKMLYNFIGEEAFTKGL
ncbi:MAG TPA: M1 family metallopeptidase, partial [Candidatus Saccharimonadales bacterium]|nr:M1 family metallopeptidase [Candidatus Saccharimonadales bacterium]